MDSKKYLISNIDYSRVCGTICALPEVIALAANRTLAFNSFSANVTKDGNL